jgi:hypothetical protein
MIKLLGSALGSFVAMSFSRFLGPEVSGKFLILFCFFIVGLILIFFYRKMSLKKKSRLFFLIYVSILVLMQILRFYLNEYFYEMLGFAVLSGAGVLFYVSGSGESLPRPAPSDPSSSASCTGTGTEYSLGISVLLESWPKSTETETGTSVNQPEARPVPPANPVASQGEEAGPSNRPPRVVPYPYQPDEVIGGDSVQSIQRRLLANYDFPSAEVIRQAQMGAEDLFEVKVEIIKLMAGLDPTGDWMGRGARALDNSRTATGEESLERLYSLLEDLQGGGVKSATFCELKGRVPLRIDSDENSSA